VLKKLRACRLNLLITIIFQVARIANQKLQVLDIPRKKRKKPGIKLRLVNFHFLLQAKLKQQEIQMDL
jgi:hypothetical protein